MPFDTLRVSVSAYATLPYRRTFTREEVNKFLAKLVPIRRIGEADDVAGAVRYLLSDEANFVTGPVL